MQQIVSMSRVVCAKLPGGWRWWFGACDADVDIAQRTRRRCRQCRAEQSASWATLRRRGAEVGRRGVYSAYSSASSPLLPTSTSKSSSYRCQTPTGCPRIRPLSQSQRYARDYATPMLLVCCHSEVVRIARRDRHKLTHTVYNFMKVSCSYFNYTLSCNLSPQTFSWYACRLSLCTF